MILILGSSLTLRGSCPDLLLLRTRVPISTFPHNLAIPYTGTTCTQFGLLEYITFCSCLTRKRVCHMLFVSIAAHIWAPRLCHGELRSKLMSKFPQSLAGWDCIGLVIREIGQGGNTQIFELTCGARIPLFGRAE